MIDSPDKGSQGPVTTGRLPYERPAVVSEEVFETMALSCANATRVQCPGSRPDRS